MIGNSLLGRSRFSHRGIGGTGLSWLVAGSVKLAPAQKPCESGSEVTGNAAGPIETKDVSAREQVEHGIARVLARARAEDDPGRAD